MARSAAAQAALAGSFSGARSRRTLSSPARQATASMPCPTAGSMISRARISLARCARPRRSRPQSASKVASTSPASSFLSRVSALPRNGTILRSGRRRNSWAWRRSEAVPTTAPRGNASRRPPLRDNSASRGSSRVSTAPSSIPWAKLGFEVLQRMHREIDPAGEQCGVDLFGKEALAADLGERAVLHPVAGGADRHDPGRPLGAEFRMRRGDQLAHARRLVERHRAAASCRCAGCGTAPA